MFQNSIIFLVVAHTPAGHIHRLLYSHIMASYELTLGFIIIFSSISEEDKCNLIIIMIMACRYV